MTAALDVPSFFNQSTSHTPPNKTCLVCLTSVLAADENHIFQMRVGLQGLSFGSGCLGGWVHKDTSAPPQIVRPPPSSIFHLMPQPIHLPSLEPCSMAHNPHSLQFGACKMRALLNLPYSEPSSALLPHHPGSLPYK